MSKTLIKENSKTLNIGGSLYVRVPALFARTLDLKTSEEVCVGLAEGKYGKFLWVAKKEE